MVFQSGRRLFDKGIPGRENWTPFGQGLARVPEVSFSKQCVTPGLQEESSLVAGSFPYLSTHLVDSLVENL
jgi:hypothetical protein